MSTTRKKANPPPPIDVCLFDDPTNTTISLSDLRRIASQGIVDQGSHRSVAWRVLLGYLPEDRTKWPAVLEEKRALYKELVHKVFSSPTTDDGLELMSHHGKQHNKESLRLAAEQHIDELVLGVKQASLKSMDSERNNAQQQPLDTYKKKEEDLVPSPVTKDGTVECVPLRIREQWKRSGRDSTVLVEMSNATGRNVHGMNTLLVVDNDGKAVKESSKEENDEDSGDDKWSYFFENASLLDEIRKDVVRTHPDLKFFLEPTNNLGHRRYAAMERILFVWAKLNKGVSVLWLLCCVYCCAASRLVIARVNTVAPSNILTHSQSSHHPLITLRFVMSKE